VRWFDELAFRARGALRWSVPALKRSLTFDQVISVLPEQARGPARALSSTYDLSAWSGGCSYREWVDSLYALDVLARVIPRELPPGRAVEIGAKNGSMLPALATLTGRGCDAIELDAHRRYLWGSTRRVYGEALAARFPDCRFVADDVRNVAGPWALATWWLPFLTPGPLEAWGLPARFLVPAELLEVVRSRILPGGALFVVNQGEEEGALQGRLFDQLGMRATSLGAIESALSPFERPRVGWLWRSMTPVAGW
jgi:hypothetical protein